MKKQLYMMLLVILTVLLGVNHVHDEYCGYDDKTQTGCIYEVGSVENNHPGY